MAGVRNDQTIVDALAAMAHTNEALQVQHNQQGGNDEGAQIWLQGVEKILRVLKFGSKGLRRFIE